MTNIRRSFWVAFAAIAAICLLSTFEAKAKEETTPSFDKSGLYYGSKPLSKSGFEFVKRPMEGLKINHYADGKYQVNSKPEMLRASETFTFYLVPNRPMTLGGLDEVKGTAFEVKRGFHVFRVQENGVFVTVREGHKEGQLVDYTGNKMSDKVKTAHEGLVQQRKQVIKIEIKLPKGKYVFFEGEGNTFDKEAYPTKDQGCWYVEIIGN